MWYYFINANQFCKCTQLKSYTEIRLKYIREANCQFWLLFCFRVCNALSEAESIPLKDLLKKTTKQSMNLQQQTTNFKCHLFQILNK